MDAVSRRYSITALLNLFHTDYSDKQRDALVLAGITVVAATFFGFQITSHEYLRGWDASTHIFFSSAYSDEWWNTWDFKWYGGYSRLSYPPLAHQLVAITAALTRDLRLSYELVGFAFLCVGPLAVYWFSRNFVDKRSSIVAAALFVFLPSIRSMVFLFGQFAGLVALVLLLLAMGSVGDFLRTGRMLAGFSATCLLASSVASHHATTLFLLVPTFIVTTMANRSKGDGNGSWAVRSVAIWTACAVATLIVVLPFWVWFLDLQVQVPIPHPSRDNILEVPYIRRVFFLDFYGPLLLVVPAALIGALDRMDRVLLAGEYVVFLILGLGGTTVIPAVLFGVQWQWLTYERFGVWATILLLPLLGKVIVQARNQFTYWIVIAATILLVTLSFSWMIDPSKYRITPSPLDLDPVIEYLIKNPGCAERYLALGFDYQLPELSTYADAKTLDGLWHTARRDPLLRHSGIGQLSDALYWDDGAQVLHTFLARSSPVPAYCILINETAAQADEYRKIVTEHGWRDRGLLSDEVSLWLNDSISPETRSMTPAASLIDQGRGYLWGTLPILSLSLAITITIACGFDLERKYETGSSNDFST